MIQVSGANGAFGKMTLPKGFEVLAQAEFPVLLVDLPQLWHVPLFGKKLKVHEAEVIIEQLSCAENIPSIASMGDRQLDAFELERAAGEMLIREGRTPVGWHVPGPGNLTNLLIGWADELVVQLRLGDRIKLIQSLGGAAGKSGQKLRHVDVLAMLRDTPIRMGGSFNGVSVSRSTLGGLALVCVALTSRRVQDCIKQAVEKLAEFGEDTDEDGWPSFFTPAMAYGQLSAFAANNVSRFTGHVTAKFRPNQQQPELDVLGARPGLLAHIIGNDLAEGRCHVPHDQLKNASVGGGARGTWLVDGQVVSLCGAGSKPEKFLNRQKLLTGNGAVLLERRGSKLRIQVD